MKYSKLLFENSFRFPQTCKFENNKKKRVSVRTVSTEYAIDRPDDRTRGGGANRPAGGANRETARAPLDSSAEPPRGRRER